MKGDPPSVRVKCACVIFEFSDVITNDVRTIWCNKVRTTICTDQRTTGNVADTEKPTCCNTSSLRVRLHAYVHIYICLKALHGDDDPAKDPQAAHGFVQADLLVYKFTRKKLLQYSLRLCWPALAKNGKAASISYFKPAPLPARNRRKF